MILSYCGVWLLSLVPLDDASLELEALELELSLLLPTPEIALLLDELPDSLPALLPELFGCSLVALPVLFVSNDPPWKRFVSLPELLLLLPEPYTLDPEDPCVPLWLEGLEPMLELLG